MNQLIGQMFNAQPSQQVIHNEFIDALMTGDLDVLRNRRRKSIRLVPLFDHGLPLVFRCETPEQLANADVMADKPVQCFVGSRSSWENLKLIPKYNRPWLNALTEADRSMIMNELDDALPRSWQDKI